MSLQQPSPPAISGTEPAAESQAAAVPPTRLRKRKKADRVRPTQCLNCAAPTTGNFCAECGQENENQTVAIKLLARDFLSDLASFDSKLLRTLVPLIVRPGFLTNEYNLGRRVRYVSPFKLYLTMSVLFFIVLPLTRHDSLVDFQPDTVPHTLQSSRDAGSETTAKQPTVHKSGTLTVGTEKYDLAHLPPTLAAYDAQQKDPQHAHDSKLMQYVLRQIIKIRQNPQALQAGLLDDIPKMMFVLLPAFALSLKLVYLRSKRLYIEHLIFSLHLHAFIFLLLTVLLTVQAAAPQAAAVVPIAVSAALLYPYIAMRVVYKQGWVKTFVKYNLLAFNYLFLLTFTLMGALAVAFLVL